MFGEEIESTSNFYDLILLMTQKIIFLCSSSFFFEKTFFYRQQSDTTASSESELIWSRKLSVGQWGPNVNWLGRASVTLIFCGYTRWITLCSNFREIRHLAGDCRCFPWIAMDRKTENMKPERLIQSSFHCSLEAVLHNSRKSIDSKLHLGSSKSRNISDATLKWKFFMFACKCWKLLSCQWSHAVPWNPFCQCSGKCLKKIDNIPFHFWCVCWLSDSISTLE